MDAHGSDDRDLARIRTICLRFPEAEEAELQDRPLFRVRARRFALFNGNAASTTEALERLRTLPCTSSPIRRIGKRSRRTAGS